MRYLDRLLRLLSSALRPCLVLLLATAAASALGPRDEIQVLDATGTVLQLDAQGVAQVMETGTLVKRGARLTVAADGRLVLGFSSGARLLVEGESSFQLGVVSASPSRGSVVELRTQQGRFTVTLPRQGPGDVFLVRTEKGDQYLKSRGLYQWYSIPDSDALRLTCLAGEVLFSPKEAAGGQVRLRTGEQLNLDRPGARFATSIEPMDASARRAIVERLAYDREFKVYPLEPSPLTGLVGVSSGGGTSAASLSSVLAAIEEVVERQTQSNLSPTGG
jgi:hypothetical protein